MGGTGREVVCGWDWKYTGGGARKGIIDDLRDCEAAGAIRGCRKDWKGAGGSIEGKLKGGWRRVGREAELAEGKLEKARE